MQKSYTFITALSVVIALLAGYLLGNVLPLRIFSAQNTSPSSQTVGSGSTTIPDDQGRLEVIVKNSNNEPMVGIEVDVGVQAGPPPSWGVKEADVNGKASFDLAPGSYFVYFNMNRFPSGYAVPVEQKVEIKQGQTKSLTIVLERS